MKKKKKNSPKKIPRKTEKLKTFDNLEKSQCDK